MKQQQPKHQEQPQQQKPGSTPHHSHPHPGSKPQQPAKPNKQK
jgi:hypothetical protein